MSPRSAVEELAVGRRPRADLIPPEIVAEHQAKKTRRRLLLGLLGVLLVVGLAAGGATWLNVQSQFALLASQARTADLLVEQAKYIEVRRVQEEIALIESGRKVGASTEILWKDYLLSVQSKLPADVVVMSVLIESASPLSEFAQSDEPLQEPRVATLTFSAVSATLPDVTSWLDGLADLPGYVGATPASVSLDEESRLYTSAVTMQIDEGAWSERFTPDDEKVGEGQAGSEAGE
ncbi:hypothetical protein ELQ90_11845 [Labedella phragmitis]|uniref:Fimbrial assembly protein n=1 Tax=Labedella phragmitis TaxID=2498849 RepID=A0A444PRY6_9MICO|nr:hypothetical protein [Labedella phragmitis]RWZ50030.1 hypothetical protein ELQ90_11845 [Labedella phragmitis]